MRIPKRPIAWILTFFVLCAAGLASLFSKEETVSTDNSPLPSQTVIILDAGHGGFDGGAVAPDGTIEKDINLNIALTLRDLLRQNGFFVVMTRESDISTDDVGSDRIATRKRSDLENRLNLMKTYSEAFFVSVHLNKFTTSAANGSQVFYSPRDDDSKRLGEEIQRSIVELLQPENRRVNKQATSSTYLLYHAVVPAVLVECGFLSNHAELEKLKNEEYQKQLAFCIFCGIINYVSQ